MFFHTWLRLHVFLCFALVTCFATHESPYTFSHAWHCDVTCFLTRHSAYIFSCPWHWLRVCQHMTWLTHFLYMALVTCMFFFIAWIWTMCRAFSIFPLVIRFAAGDMFYQAWQHSLPLFWLSAGTDSLCKLLLFLWLVDHMGVFYSLLYKTSSFLRVNI